MKTEFMENRKLIEFSLIYNRHKKPLLNYIYNLVRCTMTAEDLMQNTFIKLYDNIGLIRNSSSIPPWLYTTARNEVFAFIRKTKRMNEQDIDNAEKGGKGFLRFNDFELDELKSLIDKELKEMPFEQSEVYYLKVHSSLTYKEIAAIMNITEDLVRSRIHNVRQKLKNILVNFEGK